MPQTSFEDELRTLNQKLSQLLDLLSRYVQPQGSNLRVEVLDGQEVMQQLNISRRTLQTLRSSNKIVYRKVNGKIYYPVEELKRMVGQR